MQKGQQYFFKQNFNYESYFNTSVSSIYFNRDYIVNKDIFPYT